MFGSCNAVAGAQRRGFLPSTKDAERLGCDSGRVDGPTMVPAENAIVGRQCGFTQRERFIRRLGGGKESTREIASRAIRARMRVAESLLVDAERTPVKRQRRRVIALGLEQEGKAADRRRRIGMVFSQIRPAYRQHTFIEWTSAVQIALCLNESRKTAKTCNRMRVIWTEHLFAYGLRSLRETLCVYKVALFLKQRCRRPSR